MRLHNLLMAAAGAAAIFSTSLSSRAAVIPYTLASSGATEYLWGTGKVEVVDIAIHISDPALAGKRITGFTVPMGSDQEITEISGWLSTELKLTDKVNDPDICAKAGVWAGTNANGTPTFTVTFDEPYTLTADGVYAGYSFKVGKASTNGQKNPVVVSAESRPGGFYVHTSRTYLKWDDKSSLGCTSYLTLNLEGDFAQIAAAPLSITPVLCEYSKPVTASVAFANHGTQPIESLSYTYYIDGVAAPDCPAKVIFDRPVPAQFGAQGAFDMPLTVSEPNGSHSLSVTIGQVNGVDNPESDLSASSTATVMAFVPVMRPLVEEYTGLWCGWCPRGFIAMERMSHELGDRFIGLAYHIKAAGVEPMMLLSAFPGSPGGLPGAILNRAKEVDPYYGTSQTEDMHILKDWAELAAQFPEADLQVTTEWIDASHLKANASVRFVDSSEGSDFRIAFALVGNNLTGAKWADTPYQWKQANYYSGKTDMVGDDWKVFTEGGAEVTGLVYNDVVLQYDWKAAPGSLPSSLAAAVPVEATHTFDLSTVLNERGHYIVNDPAALRVVAVVTKGDDGAYVNAAKSSPAGDNPFGSVTDAATDSEVISVEWHDLQGRRIASPSRGLYLRTATTTSGHRTTTKISL